MKTSLICGDLWLICGWFVVICGWFVVVCGDLWWFAVICGDYMDRLRTVCPCNTILFISQYRGRIQYNTSLKSQWWDLSSNSQNPWASNQEKENLSQGHGEDRESWTRGMTCYRRSGQSFSEVQITGLPEGSTFPILTNDPVIDYFSCLSTLIDHLTP